MTKSPPKYRSREAPLPGSSVTGTHHGYWADHVKLENHIRDKWYKEYGQFYYAKAPQEEQQSPICGQLPTAKPREYLRDTTVPQSEPVAYLRACIKEHQERSKAVSQKTVGKGYIAHRFPAVHRDVAGQCHEVQRPPRRAYEDPSLGNFDQGYPVPTSANPAVPWNDKARHGLKLDTARSVCKTSMLDWTTHPCQHLQLTKKSYGLGKHNPAITSCDPNLLPLPVPAVQCPMQRKIKELPLPDKCLTCFHLQCNCAPGIYQNIPPAPLSRIVKEIVWCCEPSYCGSKCIDARSVQNYQQSVAPPKYPACRSHLQIIPGHTKRGEQLHDCVDPFYLA